MLKLIVFCLSILPLLSQNIIILPKWNVGEVKNFTVSVKNVIYDGDRISRQDSIKHVGKITVVGVTDSHFHIIISYKNFLALGLIEVLKKMGKYIEYSNIDYHYYVSKKNGEFDIQNWEEVQKNYHLLINKFTNAVEERYKYAPLEYAEKAKSFIESSISPIKNAIFDKQNIHQSIQNEIAFILVPYGKLLKINSTLSKISKSSNPLSPNVEMDQSVVDKLLLVDSEKAYFSRKIEIDTSQFKKGVKAMFDLMMQSDQATEKDKKEMNEFLKNFKYTYQNNGKYTVDLQTGWVISSNSITNEERSSPGGGTNKTKIIINVAIN